MTPSVAAPGVTHPSDATVIEGLTDGFMLVFISNMVCCSASV